jgi:hypothetical protein
MGEWIVDFPEEMEKTEINRIMIRVFRILESDGITVTKKEDLNETDRNT